MPKRKNTHHEVEDYDLDNDYYDDEGDAEYTPVNNWFDNLVELISGIVVLIVGIVLIIIALWAGGKIWDKAKDIVTRDVWTGVFYYDPTDLTKYWRQPDLTSLEACRSWVNSQIARDFDGYYDYECGKNCGYKKGFTIEVCATTER